ncbi:MAG: hypothetical protein ACM33T_07960 [Solirubrobacterales bacterium]
MSRLAQPFLKAWHAMLAGGFVVAFLTGDEDTYAMHLFSGLLVLGLLVLRVVVSWAAPGASVLNLRRPGRKPVLMLTALALLAAIGAAAATGLGAHFLPFLEDLHEAVSNASLTVIAAHVVVVVAIFRGKAIRRWLTSRLSPASTPG